jgi:tetratricopeptide (TPR) repeat protein
MMKKLVIFCFLSTALAPAQAILEDASIEQRLSKSPNDPALANQLGETLITQGRLEEAKAAFERAAALGPDRPEILENLALVNLMLHINSGAAQAAARLLDVDPSNYNGHLVLGITLLNNGDRPQALSHFQVLRRLNPADPLVRAGLIEAGGTEAQSGSQQERRELSAVDISPADALLASQIFQVPPLNGYVLPWLESARRANPNNADLLPLAQAYIDTRQYVKARDVLVLGIRRGAQNGLPLLKLSLVEFELHDSDKAQLLLMQAKNAIGAQSRMLLTFAAVCLQEHRFVEARDSLERFPNDSIEPKRHYLLGLTYAALGDVRARDELSTALSINPENVSALVAMAACDLKHGDIEPASQRLARAIQLNAANAPAHYYMGQCYRRMARPKEASAEFQKAVRLDPLDGRAHAEIGNVLISEGKNTEAIAELRKALALDDTIAAAHYRLGLLLRHTSATSEALEHLRIAKSLRKDEEAEIVMDLVPHS